MYQRILVAVDGSSTSLTGLGEAIRLAQVTGGRLKLVHVLNVLIGAEYGMGVDANVLAASIRANGAEIIDEAAAITRKAGVAFEQQVVESFGRPADGAPEPTGRCPEHRRSGYARPPGGWVWRKRLRSW